MNLRGAPIGDAPVQSKEEVNASRTLVEDEQARRGRLRDAGLLPAWMWASCSTLVYGCEVSAILAMNPGLPAVPFFHTPAYLSCSRG
jgi:hypothetical protein